MENILFFSVPIFMGLSWSEILLIFLVILLLFGATRLPQIGKGLGEGIRNFKKSLKGINEDEQKSLPDEPKKEDKKDQ